MTGLMETLHDILWNLRNEDLNKILKLLRVKARSARKADLIDAIKRAFAGSGLREIWDSLDELEQAAVAEACYAADLAYDAARITAKHGRTPAFFNTPQDERRHSWQGPDWKYATRLNLLLWSADGRSGRIVPTDVAEQLRTFVPEPPELLVPTIQAPADEEGLIVRETEHDALVDVIALLRLAEKGDLRMSAKTGKVSAAGCGKILGSLCAGDFYPPEVAYRPNKRNWEQEIGPIKPIAWARMLHVAGYVSSGSGKSRLTSAGIKALASPPHQLIRRMWQQWRANTTFDEFNRIEAIKGQGSKGHMTAKPLRRTAIIAALCECPPGEWITTDAFSLFMQGAGFDFEVTRNPWKLYLGEARYGSLGYDGFGGWNIVQHRYILCFLFEYAATLGLIDIAYVHPREGLGDYSGQWGADDLEWLSRYDGLRAFRITNLGAYCLGLSNEFKPMQPRSSLALTVLPSRVIRLRSGTPQPAESLFLETWAEPVEAGVWQLDANRALEAVERGQKPGDFADFLRSCDDQPLPELVEGFLRDAERDGTAVRSAGEAQLFDCRDADTAALIHAQKELRGHCHRCGETLLAVASPQVPKFRKVARSLGLGVV